MFVTSRPDGRQRCVNFAYPGNDRVQVIGSETHVFCMIHGRQQDQVEAQVQALLQAQLLSDLPHPLLFSSHAFKQCGGRYAPSPTGASLHVSVV
ncbi:hypothetical protein PS838_00886 [Pseudomonas fluorescens]|nr:hypothetical protein PS838_00886 [Pseudomonas fluorescens]